MSARLYSYYRSSAAYRVRIALNLKGLRAEIVPVHLRHGEQRGEAYRALNPAGLVPWFTDGTVALAQSLAIIEYLEEAHPAPALLPAGLANRAYAREIAHIIACDIHPIGNLRVLDKLSADHGATPEARAAWNRHWMAAGFGAIEARLEQTAGAFAVGDAPGLADLCIVPQLYNARRFGLDLSPYPRLAAVEAAARALPAFIKAAPEHQPDFEEGP
ncbi:maleylacetoacetate isomerase [Acidocella sp.]|uniref:maleylacetoacetate isomerase n=1 Tax=Acidocella sp. TaxID=50710 RepID=UPI00261009ED|nr:maleylacetoacetate isomerase [Acidocella sp.]